MSFKDDIDKKDDSEKKEVIPKKRAICLQCRTKPFLIQDCTNKDRWYCPQCDYEWNKSKSYDSNKDLENEFIKTVKEYIEGIGAKIHFFMVELEEDRYQKHPPPTVGEILEKTDAFILKLQEEIVELKRNKYSF